MALGTGWGGGSPRGRHGSPAETEFPKRWLGGEQTVPWPREQGGRPKNHASQSPPCAGTESPQSSDHPPCKKHQAEEDNSEGQAKRPHVGRSTLRRPHSPLPLLRSLNKLLLSFQDKQHRLCAQTAAQGPQDASSQVEPSPATPPLPRPCCTAPRASFAIAARKLA